MAQVSSMNLRIGPLGKIQTVSQGHILMLPHLCAIITIKNSPVSPARVEGSQSTTSFSSKTHNSYPWCLVFNLFYIKIMFSNISNYYFSNLHWNILIIIIKKMTEVLNHWWKVARTHGRDLADWLLAVPERVWNHLYSPFPNWTTADNLYIAPLIGKPSNAVSYYKREIVIGTLFNMTLISFYAWTILPNWLVYFWERKIASFIWTSLFLLHVSGVLTKIIIGIWFRSVQANDNRHCLRQKLITFFRTNVFYYNFRVGTYTLIAYFITILYGVIEHFDQTSSYVATSLFYWCVAFIVRIVVSVTRFNKLFRDDPYGDNKTDLFDLPEFQLTPK
jgi:hypothetical protein